MNLFELYKNENRNYNICTMYLPMFEFDRFVLCDGLHVLEFRYWLDLAVSWFDRYVLILFDLIGGDD